MYMPYSNNPNLPHVRMEAVKLVRSGMSVRVVARHFGFSHSAIVKWVARAPYGLQKRTIPTRISRPHHHPKELDPLLVSKIVELRKRKRKCAFILHHELMREGIIISLSSVKRIIKRNQLSKFSKWKRWHTYPPRPVPESPGILVEIDTIHDGPHEDRLYIYTLLDVCSRWAYAFPTERITTHRSLSFVRQAQEVSPFSFQTLQSDHGSEFSKWFTKKVGEAGLSHRHSRIRTPNDNAHLERFNRTIQEECIYRLPRNIRVYKKEIPEYLKYYNTQRPHMGLAMKTPSDIIHLVPRY